jgi:pyrophosphate--fructose-6-phosphate 1-phosphotransferase
VSLKLNGYLVAIDQIEKEAAFWMPYCIPLLSMATLEMRHGRIKPVIKKALVDLKGNPFSVFEQERHSWRLSDDYRQTGPIQYWRKGSFFDKPLTLIP